MSNCLYNGTLRCLPEAARKRVPFFLSCLEQACATDRPPYGENWYFEIYRALAKKSEWLSNLFIRYSGEEIQGSIRLGSLRVGGKGLFTKTHDKLLARHQGDEARHAHNFLHYCAVVFPGMRTDAAEKRLKNLAQLQQVALPTFSRDRINLEIVQINIGETKNRIHLNLIKSAALSHCPTSAQDITQQIGDRFIRDEIRHIYSTALILESLAKTTDAVTLRNIYIKEFCDLNAAIRTELGR